MFKFIAAASVAASAFALSALAAQAAPISAGGYYQDQVLKDCSNTQVCVFKFAAIPAGKTLIVESVGCAITSAQSVGAMSLTSRLNGTLVGRSAYPIPVYLGTFGGIRRYNVNSAVTSIMTAGEVPEMTVTALANSANFIPYCSISGELK